MNFAYTGTGGIAVDGTGNQVSSAWGFEAIETGGSLGGVALVSATYVYRTPVGGFAILGGADNIISSSWSWSSFCHDHAANFGGYNFLGTPSPVTVANESFTFSCWVYFDSLKTNGIVAGVVESCPSMGALAECIFEWGIFASTSGIVFVVRTDSGTFAVVASAFGAPPLKEWIHIIVSFDGSTGTDGSGDKGLKIIINNTDINSTSLIYKITDQNLFLTIGAPTNGKVLDPPFSDSDDPFFNFITGRIDKAALWFDTYTSGINDFTTSLYNQGAGLTSDQLSKYPGDLLSGLQGYWNLVSDDYVPNTGTDPSFSGSWPTDLGSLGSLRSQTSYRNPSASNPFPIATAQFGGVSVIEGVPKPCLNLDYQASADAVIGSIAFIVVAGSCGNILMCGSYILTFTVVGDGGIDISGESGILFDAYNYFPTGGIITGGSGTTSFIGKTFSYIGSGGISIAGGVVVTLSFKNLKPFTASGGIVVNGTVAGCVVGPNWEFIAFGNFLAESSLDGTQMTPPNSSSATGTASILFAQETNIVTINFSHDVVESRRAFIIEAAPKNDLTNINVIFTPSTGGEEEIPVDELGPVMNSLVGNTAWMITSKEFPVGEIRGAINFTSGLISINKEIPGAQYSPLNWKYTGGAAPALGFISVAGSRIKMGGKALTNPFVSSGAIKTKGSADIVFLTSVLSYVATGGLTVDGSSIGFGSNYSYSGTGGVSSEGSSSIVEGFFTYSGSGGASISGDTTPDDIMLSFYTYIADIDNVIEFSGTLSTDQMVPETWGNGNGTFTMSLNRTTNIIDYTVTYQDLFSTRELLWEGYANPGMNPAITQIFIAHIPPPNTATNTPGSITSSRDFSVLSDAARSAVYSELFAGRLFWLLKTSRFTNGELRGQTIADNFDAVIMGGSAEVAKGFFIVVGAGGASTGGSSSIGFLPNFSVGGDVFIESAPGVVIYELEFSYVPTDFEEIVFQDDFARS